MLKVVFVGTADFACSTLAALLQVVGCTVLAVYTKPDRPKGRGLKVLPSAVKLAAQSYGLPVIQPDNLRDEETLRQLRAWGADLLVNVACGFLLPAAVLSIFPKGCLNIHPSLLPRWRGAAPIQRAIMAGDEFTGVSVMQMDEGLDTGAVYLQEKVKITDLDNAATLAERLAMLGGKLLQQVLAEIIQGKAVVVAQSPEGVTYADKIDKSERLLDWSSSARVLSCKVRGLNPSYVAYTTLEGERWLVRDAQVGHFDENDLHDLKLQLIDDEWITGRILEVTPKGAAVAVGNREILWLTGLQLAGGRSLTAKDFYNAYRGVWLPGVVLGK